MGLMASWGDESTDVPDVARDQGSTSASGEKKRTGGESPNTSLTKRFAALHDGNSFAALSGAGTEGDVPMGQ